MSWKLGIGWSRERKELSIKLTQKTTAWEQRKVNDLVVERNQQSPKSKEYPLMAFVANEGVAAKGDRFNREFLVLDEHNKKYKKMDYSFLMFIFLVSTYMVEEKSSIIWSAKIYI